MKKNLLIIVLLVLVSVVSAIAKTGIAKSDFSPNGKLLATVSFDGELVIWDLQTYKQVKSLNLRSEQINLVKFLPDGKSLAFIDEQKDKLSFIDLLTGKITKSWKYNKAFGLENMFFSSDAQTLWMIYGGNMDSGDEAYIVDLKTNKLKIEKPLKGLSWISNSTKNLAAFYVKAERKIYLVSLLDGKEISSFTIDKDYILDEKVNFSGFLPIKMDFSRDGTQIYLYRKIAGEKKDSDSFINDYIHELLAYSVANGRLLKKEKIEAGKVEGKEFRTNPEIAYSSDGKKITLTEVSDSPDEVTMITVLDSNTFQKIKETKYSDTNSLNWYESNPEGSLFLTSDSTAKIKVWTNETQKQVAEFFSESPYFSKIAVTADDSKIAAITPNGLIKIWSADGKNLQTINTKLPKADFLAFSPDGQTLLSVHFTTFMQGNDEETLAKYFLWNTSTGKLLREFDNYFSLEKSPKHFAFFSPKGDRIMFDCGVDENLVLGICVMNAATGEFYGKPFQLIKNSTNFFWLADNDVLTFGGAKNNKPGSEDVSDEGNYLLWNLANEKLLKQTTDLTELVEAFPKNQKGKLIVVDPSEFNERYQMLEITNLEGFEPDLYNIFEYIFNEDKKLGVKFIPAPPEAGNLDKGEDGFPLFGNSDSLIFINAPKEDINENIEVMIVETIEYKTLSGHTDDVIGFVFAGDGRGISTSYDGTIRVWDLEAGKELLQLK